MTNMLQNIFRYKIYYNISIFKYHIFEIKQASNFADIDECSTGSHSCGLNTRCINLPGTYSCPCKTGFAVNPLRNVCEGKELGQAN